MEALDITILALCGWVAILAFAVLICAVAGRADERHEELADLAAGIPQPQPSSPRGFARSGREVPAARSRIAARA